MNEILIKLQNKENLNDAEVHSAMEQIMSGEANPDQISQFLMGLREKGPTIDEITGAAKIMRKFSHKVSTKHTNLLDTCGTGGDKKNTFNISTVSAIVTAAAGAVVAKHGNRSITSKCGSACILEELGVNLDLNDEQLGRCLDEVNIAFLFAQKLHPAMKNVAPIRKELGVETIFNVLGPLTNPAQATHQIMGVYHRDYIEPMAHVLKNLGLKKALVVHGNDGLDEITTTDQTFISEYNGDEIISYDITPEEFGIAKAQPEDLEGGQREQNADIVRCILDGEKGPKRDVVLINAAYGLYISSDKVGLNDCLDQAREAIDSGKAKDKLQELIDFTNGNHE